MEVIIKIFKQDTSEIIKSYTKHPICDILIISHAAININYFTIILLYGGLAFPTNKFQSIELIPRLPINYDQKVRRKSHQVSPMFVLFICHSKKLIKMHSEHTNPIKTNFYQFILILLRYRRN